MKSLINISIDDISPHPRSSLKVLDRCYELIDIFPKIKFSLFVPAAYWRTHKPGTISKEPLFISQYPEFCQELSNLDKNNFEIGYHGYYHGIPGENDNDEFKNITYEEANKKINLMLGEAEKSGLSGVLKKIFRPPAWKMNPEVFKAFDEHGFELFALTDQFDMLKVYDGAEKNYPSVFSRQFPPFRELTKEEKCGIVYHACEWDRNYLSVEYTKELSEFLFKDTENIEFCFMKEMLWANQIQY
tara:strand:- start:5559 stop:6290 length:732 start_codon:yes stop_codon:yes gene_type:complete